MLSPLKARSQFARSSTVDWYDPLAGTATHSSAGSSLSLSL
jgi:hypothetical protein